MTTSPIFDKRVDAKLMALKERGIFQCKLPDIFVGSYMVRIDQEDPKKPLFQIGSLQQLALGGEVTAHWFLTQDVKGWTAFKEGIDTDGLIAILDKYNGILDDLMVIADNGLLT